MNENKDYAKVGKIAVAVVAAILVIIIASIALKSCGGGNYKTPVKQMEKYYNGKLGKDGLTILKNFRNGVAEKETNAVLKILKKSDDYKDTLEETNEYVEEFYDYFKEEIGSDYKFSIKITDKEKLDKDELETYEDRIRDYCSSDIEELIEDLEDYKDDDWDDIDEMGFTKSQAKSLLSASKTLVKKLEKLEVTDGYELEITTVIKGSELDEPRETESEMIVLKVNGKWVAYDMFTSSYSILDR